jgi:hypothetical protein
MRSLFMPSLSLRCLDDPFVSFSFFRSTNNSIVSVVTPAPPNDSQSLPLLEEPPAENQYRGFSLVAFFQGSDRSSKHLYSRLGRRKEYPTWLLTYPDLVSSEPGKIGPREPTSQSAIKNGDPKKVILCENKRRDGESLDRSLRPGR